MINVWGYLKEYQQEKEELLEAIQDVLESGKLILGPKVDAFERTFAEYCGTKYGVGVGNGTDAIFLGLKALGVGPGDEVITVANTAVPTVSAITATGATPVFVDIDPDTYLMDTQQIELKVSPKTKVLLPVHLYGHCADMGRILEIAGKRGLKILEDCAQSHGAVWEGKKAGSMGDVGTFSFYPTKILGTFGDGGLCLAQTEELYQKLKKLRYYGMEKTYYSLEQGYNSRLDEIHAAILLTKMKHLDRYIARRRELARRYYEGLTGLSLTLPIERDGHFHAYFLYVVRHANRDKIMRDLKEKDIHLNISYPWPLHTMDGFSHLGYKEGDLPVTESAAREIFSLPMYPSLTNEEQDQVIEALRESIE